MHSLPPQSEHGGAAIRVAKVLGVDQTSTLDLSQTLNLFAADSRC